jgi:hypothetical protein
MKTQLFTIGLLAITVMITSCEGRHDGANSGNGTNSTNNYLGKEDSSNGHSGNSEIRDTSSSSNSEHHASGASDNKDHH